MDTVRLPLSVLNSLEFSDDFELFRSTVELRSISFILKIDGEKSV
jgi:hypothetical protein